MIIFLIRLPEVRYVLQTGLQLQPISETNKLPTTCQRWEAEQKKAMKVMSEDHEAIMGEASKCDQLEYDNDNVINEEEESESEDNELESDLSSLSS